MKTEQQEKDERQGMVSASSLGRVINCQGSQALSQIYTAPPPQDFTEAGSRIAEIIEILEKGGVIEGYDDEEVETATFLLNKKAGKFAAICEEHGYDPEDFTMIHEERMWYTYDAQPVFSGKVDTAGVHKSKPIAIVIDDKSGWMPQPPPWMNWQLKVYSLLLWQNYEQMMHPEAVFHVATNSRYWDLTATFTLKNDDPELCLSTIKRRVDMTMLAITGAPPFALGLRPGEWCRYCPARMECPVMRHGMVAFDANYGPPKVNLVRKLNVMPTRELEQALVTAEIIDHAVKAMRQEAERRIQEDPDSFELYEWTSGPPKRKSSGLGKAFEAVRPFGITEAEFLECLRTDALGVGKTSQLEKMIYAKINIGEKITHKDADDRMVDALEGAGVLEYKEPAPSLKRKKLKIEAK